LKSTATSEIKKLMLDRQDVFVSRKTENWNNENCKKQKTSELQKTAIP